MTTESTLLLAEARSALDAPAAWGTAWQRAIALLARQALEAALREVWAQTEPGLEQCSTTAQLTCVPFYVDPEIARAARQCWYALSSACHAHPYQLAPTVAELAGWIEVVADFVGAANA